MRLYFYFSLKSKKLLKNQNIFAKMQTRKQTGRVIALLDKADFERLDERYVKKDDCNDTQSKIDKRIDDEEKTLAVLVTKLNITIAILTAIAAPILAIAIKLLFGGI